MRYSSDGSFAQNSGVIQRHSPSFQTAHSLWLWGLCAMVFVMVQLGGATRLTGSGLSMVEWQPFTLLPPLSQAAWLDTFAKYQQSPQYQLENTHMTLSDFKGIFWLEYIHRLWGRFIGIAVAVPLLLFALKGALPGWLGKRMALLLVLGGLQGVLGWVMVASGLKDVPMVSPYRLAAHLGLAVLLQGALVITALQVTFPELRDAAKSPLSRWAVAFAGLVFCTILSGAFVAGLDAGLIYNTFPTMNGQWFPDDYVQTSPWWRNAFESIAAVQFHHRVIAVFTGLCGLALAVYALRKTSQTDANIRRGRAISWIALSIGSVVFVQLSLGITTLIYAVPIGLAVAHQGGALILWSLALTLAMISRNMHGEAL